MKFIKNSIDSEYLQDSISDTDLDKHMANCVVESQVLNGHHSERRNKLEKNKMEGVDVAKLSNGVHSKSESPSKCNGKVNGFYDDEEDFNLVLEDSSEGGESPSKKIYDDGISAPQIVQEIEDLLGIKSNSAGMEEELNNLDGIESIGDNLDHDDNEDSQDIQEVFEEVDEDKLKGFKEMNSETKDSVEAVAINKLSGKTTETNECDTSTHMDLVFNEVEVSMENEESYKTIESNLTSKPGGNECKVESTTGSNNTEELKDFITSVNKETAGQNDGCPSMEVEESKTTDGSVESTSDEKPSTENTLENSEDWMVLDATETSDEEKCSENEVLSVGTEATKNELNIALSPALEDDLQIQPECPLSVLNNNETTEHSIEMNDTSEKPSRTSPFPSEGDGVRKRSVSEGDEEIELKKQKLGDQSCLVGSSSSVSKRPLSFSAENESKRTKLSETSQECKTLEKEKSDRIEINGTKISEITQDYNKLEKDCQEKENSEKDEVTSVSGKHSQIPNIPVESTFVTQSFVDEKGNDTECPKINNNEETHSIVRNCSESPKISFENDGVVKPSITSKQSQEQCALDVSGSKDNHLSSKVGSPSTKETSLSTEVSDTTRKDNEPSLITIPKQNSNNEATKECVSLDKKIKNDDNKENVSGSLGTSKEEVGFKSGDFSLVKKEPTKSDEAKEKISFPIKAENKITERSKQVSITKELSTSIKELEKSVIKSAQEKAQSCGDVKHTETKKMTNLDFAIERVVEKARIQTEKKIPILKKFHKDQLKKLTRSDLEDIVVSKICEAITYKSEIGQMRLRTQNLEETNEIWRKKVQQIEKQNRELEMVLKRFLSELAHIKRENQNKVPMPIKVTRSVGLQVVLASSMHGALVTSRNKLSTEAANQPQQQQVTKAKQVEKENEKIKETSKATTFMQPNQSVAGRGRGRPAKSQTTQNSRPSTPQTLAPKLTPPTTPGKPVTPVKTMTTPNKDLEVIDLTDKEERSKSSPQPPVSGSIRVAPSTQVCFVQQSVASSPPQQPLYLVQKAGQRPQFLVATTTASPQRPINNMTRPPPALALPVFRAGGHLIPVQPVQTSPQVGLKANTNNTQNAVARPVPSALRLKTQAPVNKHPAPLPSAPASVSNPGMKAPPPKPQLKIAKTNNGIMLSWSMTFTKETAEMQSYQLYAYQEGNQPPSTGLWKKVGDVKALPLPMACTLTQFIEGHKYHFAVRAVDTHGRVGPFSTPSSILLTK